MIRSAGRALRIIVGVALLVGAALGAFFWARGSAFGGGDLRRALTGRGRVAIFGGNALLALRPDGSTLVMGSSLPQLERALLGQNQDAVLSALDREHIDALFVEPQQGKGASLMAQLASYRHVGGLRGLYLAKDAALYGRDPVQSLPASFRDATAVVARRLLEGARMPNVSSFPEPLRRVRPVEVMVMLRQDGRARLWRSARSSSIASALLTAAVIARQRWQEREQAMGGPLSRLLPELEVEVALLDEDGTVGEREPAFLDRVFFEGHGVGYERKGAWRYMLPDTTREVGKGRASRAYRKLFVDDGLPAESFERHDLRLYRLMVQTVAISKSAPSADDVSAVRSPDDVLGVRDRK